MGTPLSTPAHLYQTGTDCPTCTPQLYNPGPWPLYMYATFFDILPCPGIPPPPTNYIFKLKQQSSPCIYKFSGLLEARDFWVQLNLSLGTLELHENIPHDQVYFLAHLDPCTLYFPQNECTCVTAEGYAGRGIVRPTPIPLATLLAQEYGFMSSYGANFEHFLVAMDHTLARLARKEDHTCCYFYIDNQELPQ